METNNFKAIAYLKAGNNISFFGPLSQCAQFAEKIYTAYGDDVTEIKFKNLDIKREAKPQTEEAE